MSKQKSLHQLSQDLICLSKTPLLYIGTLMILFLFLFTLSGVIKFIQDFQNHKDNIIILFSSIALPLTLSIICYTAAVGDKNEKFYKKHGSRFLRVGILSFLILLSLYGMNGKEIDSTFYILLKYTYFLTVLYTLILFVSSSFILIVKETGLNDFMLKIARDARLIIQRYK